MREHRHHMTVEEAAAAIDRSVPTTWRRIRSAGVERFRDPATGRTLIRVADIERLDAPVPLDVPDAA